MATRQPFWKWRRWKSRGFCLWPPSTCICSLKLKFQSKLDLHSGNQVTYRVHKPKNLMAAILKMTLLKINRLLPIYISIVPLKFEVDIQSQSKVRVWKPKISNMAARRPFWKWRRWKSIGFCLWPPSTCIWNLKLKFQSKLDLCSGNHVVYRQTDGRTDKVNPVYPPPTSLGGGIKKSSFFIKHTYEVLFTWLLYILKPRQNGRHFTDNIFKCIFLNENVWISIDISYKFVH